MTCMRLGEEGRTARVESNTVKAPRGEAGERPAHPPAPAKARWMTSGLRAPLHLKALSSVP